MRLPRIDYRERKRRRAPGVRPTRWLGEYMWTGLHWSTARGQETNKRRGVTSAFAARAHDVNVRGER